MRVLSILFLAVCALAQNNSRFDTIDECPDFVGSTGVYCYWFKTSQGQPYGCYCQITLPTDRTFPAPSIGNACEDVKGRKGTCRPMDECYHVVAKMPIDRPTLCEVVPGQTIVCCPEVIGTSPPEDNIPPAQCFGGVVTFEKTVGMDFNEPQQPLLQQPGAAITNDCNALCKNTPGCQSFTVDYETSTCVSYDRTSVGRRGSVSTKQNSNLFEKMCLTGVDFSGICGSDRLWAFERVMDSYLEGHDDKIIPNMDSRTTCMKACLTEGNFTCRSADYDSVRRQCRLSREDRRTKPASFVYFPGSAVDYIENQCARLSGIQSISLPTPRPPMPMPSMPMPAPQTAEEFVSNGSPSNLNEWPWMALIGREKKQIVTWFCNGALINSKWIITAAHCLYQRVVNVVRLGENNYTDNAFGASQHVDVAIADVIFHESYKHPESYYDLALIELDKHISFTDSISPVCLPWGEEGEKSLIGRDLTLTGWGAQYTNGPFSDQLLKTELKGISNEHCEESYSVLEDFQNPSIPEGINQKLLCTVNVSRQGQDTCQGDSSGPSVYRGDRGQYFLGSIVSKGYECGKYDLPGIQVRIAHPENLPWVRKIAFSVGGIVTFA